MSGPTPTRVFVARLAGLSVFDPNGESVGRVRDAVATVRTTGESSRVIGLVVEVQGRRRIFVPMSRVTSLDRGQVITTGVVNLRRFEQRSDETLVVAELIDRKVTLLATGEEVTVVDIGMEQARTNRDWVISKVHVRKSSGGINPLRRRGESLTVGWDAVAGLTEGQVVQGAANLLATFEKLRPADLANVLHELTPKRRAEVASALDDDKLADVLEELPEDDQVEILNHLAAEQEKFLELMEPEEAEPLRRLLAYADDTAGGLMTTEAVILPPNATVAEALSRIRHRELTPAMAALVYVCRPPLETPTGKFLGVVHFQRLLREPPAELITVAMDREMKALPPETPLSDVTSFLATYNMVAAPVVDAEHRLIGVISVDDVLDHLLPEDWRGRESEEVDEDEDDANPDDTGRIKMYRPLHSS
jgi:Mg/Co/Ni transporter MgtE